MHATFAAICLAVSTVAAPPPQFEQHDLWVGGTDGYHTYRIPSIIVTKAGTVLAFCEGRKTGGGDHGDLDLVMKRSTDGGRTWSPQSIVYEEGDTAKITIGNPCPVVDQATGTIWLPFCRDNKQVLITSSDDDGKTWSKPRDISSDVVGQDWVWVATGPGVGIQLQTGPHKGRLVIPSDQRRTLADKSSEWNSHMMYSDDHGQTWKIGKPIQAGGNECQVVERFDGSLLVNTRMQGHFQGFRGLAVSTDGGETFTSIEHEKQLPCPKCQGSMIRLAGENADSPGPLLVSNPYPPQTDDGKPSGSRVRLTLRTSDDDGRTWTIARRLHEGPSAYSCLAQLPDGTMLCLYEGGGKSAYANLRVARFNKAWLDAGMRLQKLSVASPNGPAAPMNVRHTASSPAHLRVEWNDVAADEIGYRIWRREASGEWCLAGEVGPNVTHFDDGGMNPSTRYEHRVAGFNDAGEGPAAVTPEPGATLPMTAHLEPDTIIPPGKTFPAAPSAVPLKSGELLLAYQTGNAENRRHHANESIRLRTSSDDRTRWSEARLLLRGDTQTIFGKSALVRMADDRLGMTFSRWTCDEKGKIVGRTRQFIASADEGETWSEPVDVGPLSANNGTLLVADNGRLLEALSDTTGIAKIYGSDDHGRRWNLMGQVEGKRLGEAALAYVGDGRVVFISRHEWPFYRVSWSNDNGVTWEKTEAVVYLGGGDNPPKLVTLLDGKALAAVVHSWYPGRKSKDRRQLASVISRDGGRTWDNFRLIGFAPDGKDGFLQHSLTFVGDTAYLFYGGGSSGDTNDGDDLRLLRLHQDFFTSTAPWPYDARGRHIDTSVK